MSDSSYNALDFNVLSYRLINYAQAKGLLNQKNQLVFGWLKQSTHHGAGCLGGVRPVGFNADHIRRCSGSTCVDTPTLYKQEHLATHELGHIFGAGHYPNDGPLKNVCANTWDGSIMNYGCMTGRNANFDTRTRSVTYWNIVDTAP